MTTGLTLGKFAPFHRGHQSVIELALAENDQVVVVIYDAPDETRCPLSIRASWIRAIYPHVEVIEAWDGPTEISQSPKITAQHDAYLQKLLAHHDVTRFYCSEAYGQHVSLALGAVDRRVDSDRISVPVSATQIRKSPFEFREFVDPIVYRDLITKVVFLGAPSTGKTTLAKRSAAEFETVWMPEYGREYWDQNHVDRRLSLQQLTEIAQGHREREDEICLDANRLMFVDTDASTTLLFSQYYHGTAEPDLIAMAEETHQRYDLFFLCQPDIPYDDSWDRSGEVHREVFQKQIEADLITRKVPFIRLAGNVDRRLSLVKRWVERLEKFGSIMESIE